jgi:hypothetical protein
MYRRIQVCLAAAIPGLLASAAFAAPPLTEPVDVTVTNPVLPVEVSNADPIPVSVANAPEKSVSPFARACNASAQTCSVDLTDLAASGEVHITHVSGAALNVGEFASPRFRNGATEVILPPTVNSLDADLNRDVMFTQSMDLIPLDTTIVFTEPQSARVFFNVAGYVLGSGAASASATRNAATLATGTATMP